ncbi:MAG: hypothetical protein AB7L66_21385 [Gemmatimonadales bacterium]
MASPVTGNEARAQERFLRDLSRRGVRGGTIDPHRAMLRLPNPGRRLAASAALALGVLAGYLALLPAIGRLWLLIATEVHARIGMPGAIVERPEAVLGLIRFAVPTITFDGVVPDRNSLLITGAVAAVLLLASAGLRGRWLPLAYFVRAVVVVLGTAILYFSLWPDRYPYRLPQYLVGHLEAGLVMTGLVPVVLGLTFYLFDLTVARKLLLTALIMGHLVVFLPLQGLLHAWLVSEWTLVAMPVAFLLFGLLLDVMVFVAFYGWGMSWPSSLWEEARR